MPSDFIGFMWCAIALTSTVRSFLVPQELGEVMTFLRVGIENISVFFLMRTGFEKKYQLLW